MQLPHVTTRWEYSDFYKLRFLKYNSHEIYSHKWYEIYFTCGKNVCIEGAHK